MNAVSVMKALLWVAYLLYVGCFLPQVWTNYNRQSTSGLSTTTIFIYFFGYLVEILYAFLLDLPMALKVMIPAGTGVAFALVVQRLYYDARREQRARLYCIYGGVMFLFCITAGIGYWYPLVVGHACGWIGSICWLVYQIPQVYKIHQRKSVKGFNPWAMLIASTGAAIEIAAAIIIPLPAQGLFNGCRGLFFNSILTTQYFLYR